MITRAVWHKPQYVRKVIWAVLIHYPMISISGFAFWFFLRCFCYFLCCVCGMMIFVKEKYNTIFKLYQLSQNFCFIPFNTCRIRIWIQKWRIFKIRASAAKTVLLNFVKPETTHSKLTSTIVSTSWIKVSLCDLCGKYLQLSWLFACMNSKSNWFWCNSRHNEIYGCI